MGRVSVCVFLNDNLPFCLLPSCLLPIDIASYHPGSSTCPVAYPLTGCAVYLWTDSCLPRAPLTGSALAPCAPARVSRAPPPPAFLSPQCALPAPPSAFGVPLPLQQSATKTKLGKRKQQNISIYLFRRQWQPINAGRRLCLAEQVVQ